MCNTHNCCFIVLLLAGLHEVGIFRLPGQASRIQALKELYDSGSQEEFSSTEDVHTVASLLKLYLRELPQSVVPFAFYDSYKLALEGTCLPECVVWINIFLFTFRPFCT